MRRRALVWVTTLATLGSGLVDLSSVIGRNLPERHRLLREFFPLEFLHISRSLTLLIGFALVISSINIYRRKKRAFQAVLLLSCFSVVFHLTKGLDYEEAAFSAVLAVLLWFTRGSFTVRSGVPDWRSGIARLGAAFLVALGYGIAGFWFLDPKEFGINFTLVDSINRTLHFLSLAGDPQIVPYTRYAHWFIDSLYLTTVTAMVYSGFAVFRPAIYKFRTHPHEQALATRICERHGRSAQDYFKTWPDKSFFFSPSRQCFLAYRVGSSFAVALGDPVGPEAEIADTVRRFKAFCEENDWGVGFHQVLPDFLPAYLRLGFKKMKIGDEAVVDLASFTLDSRSMRSARNAIVKLEKSGVHILRFEPPAPDEVMEQLKEVSDEWLQIPGRRERQFTLGRFDLDYLRSTPMIVAADKDEKIHAFVNEIPSFRKGEATLDLMRRRTQAPNGIMDFLFVKAFLLSQAKGVERFNLGLAPMSGFQEKEEASPQERAVHTFFQQLNFLFSYKGLRAYKAKFASFWEPRYVVYRNVLELPRLALALGKVSAIEEDLP
jgi:phosphatidylglycerol lysyltransferase